MSRSEFFVTAAIHYIEALDAASLTERINAALAAATDEETERVVVAAGHPRLLDENEDW